MDGVVPYALDHPFLRAAIFLSRRHRSFLLWAAPHTLAAFAISMDTRTMADRDRVHRGGNCVDVQIPLGIFWRDLGPWRLDGDPGGPGADAIEMARVDFACGGICSRSGGPFSSG